MAISKIYEVRSVTHEGKPHTWGAKRSYDEALQRMHQRFGQENREWAEKHHKRWWIEEIDTTGLFELPTRPAPRDLFSTQLSEVETREGYWNTLKVNVLDQNEQIIASYDRNYAMMYRTFEPFRQGDRMFALIAPDYMATSVMDLATGKIIASEDHDSGGFCPVGFYVPDWWDVNDGSILPGSSDWYEHNELPKGNFGFVWGCHWGDDSSWKIQYLDLSEIANGRLVREERFGYVKLASDMDSHPKEFIKCSFNEGECRVWLRTETSFDLESGSEFDDYD